MAELAFKEYVNYKKLVEHYGPIRFMDGEYVTYDAIKERIEKLVEDYGIEATLAMGDVNYGLFSGTKEALMLVHPKHVDDYYKFCIIITPAGKTCNVEVFSYGKSRQMSAEAFAQNTKIFDGSGVMGTAAGILRGGAVGAGFAIGSAAVGIAKAGAKGIAKGINALMRDPGALEEEKAWYDIVNEIIATVIS